MSLTSGNDVHLLLPHRPDCGSMPYKDRVATVSRRNAPWSGGLEWHRVWVCVCVCVGGGGGGGGVGGGDLRHEGRVSWEGVYTAAHAHVPDAAGVIVAARCQKVTHRGPVHG